MSAWIQWLTALWPIAATLTPLILLSGFLWLKTQFAGAEAVKAISVSLTRFQTELVRIDGEIVKLGENADSEPTRLDLMAQLSGLSDRMSRMEASAEAERRQNMAQYHALERQLSTTNQYLHTLVEQTMQKGSVK